MAKWLVSQLSSRGSVDFDELSIYMCEIVSYSGIGGFRLLDPRMK